MSIARLNENTAKRLTTAQVVTSVFTVVKELVENSIDADAKNIEVTLEDGGLSLIEVRDDGKGISSVDSAFVALEAYTSKLSDFSDLDSLETYGFRGEALNALCRVADVKIITKTERDNAARCYTMHINGSIQKAEYCARPNGTTVKVEKLFKNIPVRRKIISDKKHTKRDTKAIEVLLQDFGICHPQIRISYKIDDLTVFIKPPTATLKDSLGIFDRKLSINSHFLDFESPDARINLVIPKLNIDPKTLSSVCRQNNSHIYVNNRPVVYSEFEDLISKLLTSKFDDHIPPKKKPVFFLIMKVPPADVDINLDPNKKMVLLKNCSKILKTVEQLIVDYYKIIRIEETQSQADSTTMNESLSMDSSICCDSTGNADESRGESPPPKMRKIQRNKAKASEKNDAQTNDNKENTCASNEPQFGDESQLPQVNLGEDFSTQDIHMIPTLDDNQVEAVMSEMLNSDTDKSSLKTETNELPIAVTESQWSAGHVSNITGGTSVCVLGSSSVNNVLDEMQRKKKSPHSNTDPSARGFVKFSSSIRPALIKENPDMNLVTIAKLVSDQWKNLKPDEREYYRELGRNDTSGNTSKLNSSGSSQKRKCSSATLEKNKKKMAILMESMKKRELDNKKTKMKTCVPWEVSMAAVEKMSRSSKTSSSIIGQLKENICIVRTNTQLWALSLSHLFEGLNLNELEIEESKGKLEVIEAYFKRWLIENDTKNSVGLHPIHEL